MIKGKFSTNLIGINDLLLGKGNQLQERWGSLKEVSKITLLQPLSNFNELKALDTSKFYYAMVTGKFSEADELAGYFYYFDCESIEAENLPLIVAPNKGVGRWKIIPYALDKIKAYVEDKLNRYIINELPELAKVEVTKQAEIIVPTIAREIIEEQLPAIVEEAVRQALVEVNARIDTSFTRGSYFNDSLTYPASNYTDIFLRDDKDSLVKRTYIATENTNESPVTGTQSSSENGVTIYSNNPVLQENPKYQRIKYDNLTKYKLDIAGSTPFSFSPSSLIHIKDFYGTMTFKLYGAGSAKPICSFDIQFFTETDVKFNNVFYAKSIRQRSLGSDTYGYLAFGGFCFANVLDGSLKGCLYIDNSFNLLYTYMEVESTTDFTIADNFVEILTPTTTVDIIAVRPNGGTEIADMGIIYPSLREIGGATSYESYDYYLFKNGFIAWHEAIYLPNSYTQYKDSNKFASLSIDPSDRYIANVGVLNGQTAGATKEGRAPNVEAEWIGVRDDISGQHNWMYGFFGRNGVPGNRAFWVGKGAATSGYITRSEITPAPPLTDYYDVRGLQTNSFATIKLDSSLLSSLFVSGATTIETARIIAPYLVRGF